MNMIPSVIEFAEKHLEPFKVKGDEIVPLYCPVCHGGEHGDRETFAINIGSGLACCKRGSCNWRGGYERLARMFGEDGSFKGDSLGVSFSRQKKQYSLPNLELLPPTEDIYEYFVKRKIQKATVDDFGISSDASGNIVFPFRQDGKLVYAKYRAPRKPSPGDIKEWQHPGAKPVLFGMDMCSFSQRLVITEGQIDAMSLYESGIRNTVSVPSGCENMEWIDNCWDWLERFQEILLFGDNDEPGRKMVDTLVRRLGEDRCSLVMEYPVITFRGETRESKDANEILYVLGPDALQKMEREAQPVPLKGLIDLADVTPIDPNSVHRIRTMIPMLDESVGGLMEGSVTILTGKAGNGKSTLNGQLLLAAIEQGNSVCAYSGELRKDKFQEWIHFQAAGSEYIGLKEDPVRGKLVPHVPYLTQERIRDFYRGKFFLFDNNEITEANQAQSILRVFTMAHRRYGCKLFLVDNMMTALSDSDEETKAQSKFVNSLKKFAVRYGVHILVVAHPRKTKFGEALRNDDVSGSSAIGNMADTVIVVERPNLRITKNREDGIQRLIECCYCADSRRIYQASAGDKFRISWDKEGVSRPEPRADSLSEYGVQTAQPF